MRETLLVPWLSFLKWKPRVIKLNNSWQSALQDALGSPSMTDLSAFLAKEHKAGKTIYPPEADWFHALETTPLDQVRAVILGQDPYHGPGQAHGLCFSVRPGVPVPPSLKNIYKELSADLGLAPPSHGYLEAWARQGVLMLNAVLTVEAHKAGSHQKRGWERFTDAVIRAVNERDQPVVFILWGAYAQKKAAFVDTQKHCVLTAPHPSPLSVHKGFYGSRPFSKTNAFLKGKGLPEIDWRLPETI